MTTDWQTKGRTKYSSLLASIPTKWRIPDHLPSNSEQKDVTKYIHQFLSPKEIEITESDIVEIAAHTTSGAWSAVEVTEAFCHRASMAHQLTNCLHEIFFPAALSDAAAMDAFLKEHGKPIGPLHGVPISLKDQFHVRDVDTSMGYIGWIGTHEGKPKPTNAPIPESEMVRELRALGAVLYVKTSVPHTLMSGETINNIIGYTWNPKNRNLCSGGSSGGEGALIGLRGSPGGFGTDIGGSIRIPAGFNGLYGIRPSSGRMPYEGMANSMDGQNSVLSVVGPLATTARGVRTLVESILSQRPWEHDPLVVEMPWRKEIEAQTRELVKQKGSGLAFAVMRSDGMVNPQPPVARAVQEVVDALEKAGHKVIEWDPSLHATGLKITLNTWLYDGGKDIHDAFALSGEPISPQVSMTYGEKIGKEFTASEIAANNVEKRKWQKEYMEYWNSTAELTGTGRPVDGVICPLAPYAAARPEKYKYYGYTAFVNGLDYTSVVVPVLEVDKTVDKFVEGYAPISDGDKVAYEDYDPIVYDGAHVSVQVMGRRFQEEKMLVLAEYIGGMLGYK